MTPNPPPDLPDPGEGSDVHAMKMQEVKEGAHSDAHSAGRRPAAKRGRWVAPTVAAVLAFFAGLGVGTAGSTDPAVPVAEPAPTVTVPGTVPADQLAALAAREAAITQREADLDAREADLVETEATVAEGTIPGDGLFLVGPDIIPGEYRGDGSSGLCYWARLSGSSGDLGDVITNDLPTGPTVVTIAETDYAFETNGCVDWTLVQ